MRSIHARLLLGLLSGLLIAQIMIYSLIYAKIEDEIDDLFDGELERSALMFSPGAAPLPIATPTRKVENPQEGMVIAMWEGAQARPQFQSARLEALPRETPLGFSKLFIDHRQWRLFGAASGNRYIVAAQPADVRDAAARNITVRTLMPSLAVLPASGLMIWLAVSFGLRPLMRVTSELRTRSPRDLAPIETARLPPEIAPVVRALNELMQRVGNIIAAQRNFIADAAHELLTPLTALRLQAQLLARAESASRKREVISELQGGVSRTLQLARQLLTLARHEADAVGQETTAVDLENVVNHVLAIHAPLAQAKSIRTEITVSGACVTGGNEDALHTLISNLIENAIKFSEFDGTVRVQLRREADRVLVDIEDSGPGIPTDERERVFDRFYRRSGNTASGSGLGLAIAREIATRHGAAITLQTSFTLGGLLARVEFAATRPEHCTRSVPRVA